jgi:hypothetical protein
MIGQAQIIVCAHVQNAFATGDGDMSILGRGDYSLGFEKTLRLNFFERLRNLFFEFSDHMLAADYAEKLNQETIKP